MLDTAGLLDVVGQHVVHSPLPIKEIEAQPIIRRQIFHELKALKTEMIMIYCMFFSSPEF